jgi:trk system potassium uptake protein TrkH
MTGRKISLHDRMSMAENFGENRLQGIVRLARGALLVTGTMELLGAVLLSFRFIPRYGWLKESGFPSFIVFPHSVTRVST